MPPGIPRIILNVPNSARTRWQSVHCGHVLESIVQKFSQNHIWFGSAVYIYCFVRYKEMRTALRQRDMTVCEPDFIRLMYEAYDVPRLTVRRMKWRNWTYDVRAENFYHDENFTLDIKDKLIVSLAAADAEKELAFELLGSVI